MTKYDFNSKDSMIQKLIDYSTNPDDDTIRIKTQVRDILYHSPELLYALNNKDFENELFDKDGNLNVDEEGEPLGEWDRYFGESSNIRPYLFIPETQTEAKNYLCYQVSSSELVRYNSSEKYLLLTFTIYIDGKDSMDESTGIARHDLIASIIREHFAWTGLEISTTTPTSDKEGMSDNNYITRTIGYQIILPNSIVKTEDGVTSYKNKRW